MAVVAQPVEPEALRPGDAGSIPADRSLDQELERLGFTAERLLDLSRKALRDGLGKLPPDLRSAIDQDDAIGHLAEVGLRAVGDYDESRDRGRTTLALDVRFRQFAYLRMRLRLIDWLRKNYGYSRNGTAGRVVPVSEISADPSGARVRAVLAEDLPLQAGPWQHLPVEDEFDPSTAHVSRARLARWRSLAEQLDVDLTDLTLLLLDSAAEDLLP